jgi:hypothetical protein
MCGNELGVMLGVRGWMAVVVGGVYEEAAIPATKPPESQFLEVAILAVMSQSNGATKIYPVCQNQSLPFSYFIMLSFQRLFLFFEI